MQICTPGQYRSELGPVWVDIAESSIANGRSFRPRTRVAATVELMAAQVPPSQAPVHLVGLQSFEIAVIESTGVQIRSGSVTPTTARPALVPGRPSGFIRLQIRPHGSTETWIHDGRATCVITAPGVTVDVCIPNTAANLSAGETLVSAGPGNFVYSQFTVRITAVPARSRRVTELWAEDHGQPSGTTGATVGLIPGCQEVWYDGSPRNGVPAASLLLGPDTAQGFVIADLPSGGNQLERVWVPSLGAGRIGIAAVSEEEFQTCRIVQRATL